MMPTIVPVLSSSSSSSGAGLGEGLAGGGAGAGAGAGAGGGGAVTVTTSADASTVTVGAVPVRAVSASTYFAFTAELNAARLVGSAIFAAKLSPRVVALELRAAGTMIS